MSDKDTELIEGTSVGIQEILELLPHRFPF